MTHRTLHALRWGRSAYEREADLEAERQELHKLGIQLTLETSDTPSWEGIEALVVHSKKRVTDEILAQAPTLKLVLTTTSGYDHIDVEAATTRGIRVARSPLARRDAVIDTTLGMALALLRDMAFFNAQAQDGAWARGTLPTRDIQLIRGLRVGIIGYGVIGQQAAKIWRALGAEVQIHDPKYPELANLDEVLTSSQLLTLHCSLTKTSQRLLDAQHIQMLPKGAIVLNTARGDLADVDALWHALQENHIGGLGIDVFPREPYPKIATLAAHPKCIATPHAAGYHKHLGADITKEVIATLTAYQQQLPLPHPVAIQN